MLYSQLHKYRQDLKKRAATTVAISYAATALSVLHADPGIQLHNTPTYKDWFARTSQNQNHCAPYAEAKIYRGRKHSLIIGPKDDWIEAIEESKPDTEILLEDGEYLLRQYGIVIKDKTTIRSKSGIRSNVTIQGRGYSERSEALMIAGDDVTIADISMTGIRDHAITIKPDIGGGASPHIYNVHIYDVGTQHIKGIAGSANGLIACSTIGYRPNKAIGDYNGAIDLHGAANWTLRDNTLHNIQGDGSGCIVDGNCGSVISGPAILVWNKSSGTVVTRNFISHSYRGIAFGLGRGHKDGTIRDNFIYQSNPGDAGIELQTADNTLVENNVVLLKGDYKGAIEFRQSNDAIIRGNLVTAPPWDRGRNQSIQLENNTVIDNP